MPVYNESLGGNGGIGGAGGASKQVLDRITYSEEKDRLVASVSMEFPPSTLYLGNDMAMSNAVTGIGFKLADGTDAIGIVNRFGENGSISNPKFFSLGAREPLYVNLVSDDTMSDPLEVQYQTFGDNLTYDFDIIPKAAGKLRAQYFMGTDDTGKQVFDYEITITDEMIDNVVRFGGNFYLLPESTDLFVRFSGVALAGDNASGLPYFISYVQPYKEITLNGHVERVTESQTLMIGCDYAVDASKVTNYYKSPLPSSANVKSFEVLDDEVQIYTDGTTSLYRKRLNENAEVVFTAPSGIRDFAFNGSYYVMSLENNTIISVSSSFSILDTKGVGANLPYGVSWYTNGSEFIVNFKDSRDMVRAPLNGNGTFAPLGGFTMDAKVGNFENTSAIVNDTLYIMFTPNEFIGTVMQYDIINGTYVGVFNSPVEYDDFCLSPYGVYYVYNANTLSLETKDWRNEFFTEVPESSRVKSTLAVLTVPLEFKDTFSVFDKNESFSSTAYPTINFSAHGQGIVEMKRSGDNLKFWYDHVDSKWNVVDLLDGTYTGEV